MSFGTICAPGQRYHPAVIAQAAATLSEMFKDRFWLAVGSGEALNESITGQPWPPKHERNCRLQESVRIMRALLHAAGLEVILDVVYNHTGEGNHLGPMLCLKGIDNRAYYRTVEYEPRYYIDYTGTGNSLNMRHPHSLMLVMDSLRYWVQEMHVDGFRFDLASTLARELYDVDRLSAFFDIIHQDPTLSGVKLIAEPWDIGPGGYQVGNFPVRWCEWNGRYRDTVRDYWRGQGGTLGEFASRFTGSSDLYEDDGRRPYASVNFVTAHDGFTLRDLVSYNDKHNEANGEGNNDGETHNRSWNGGAEGPTDDESVNAIRRRQQRNFLTMTVCRLRLPRRHSARRGTPFSTRLPIRERALATSRHVKHSKCLGARWSSWRGRRAHRKRRDPRAGRGTSVAQDAPEVMKAIGVISNASVGHALMGTGHLCAYNRGSVMHHAAIRHGGRTATAQSFR